MPRKSSRGRKKTPSRVLEMLEEDEEIHHEIETMMCTHMQFPLLRKMLPSGIATLNKMSEDGIMSMSYPFENEESRNRKKKTRRWLKKAI